MHLLIWVAACDSPNGTISLKYSDAVISLKVALQAYRVVHAGIPTVLGVMWRPLA